MRPLKCRNQPRGTRCKNQPRGTRCKNQPRGTRCKNQPRGARCKPQARSRELLASLRRDPSVWGQTFPCAWCAFVFWVRFDQGRARGRRPPGRAHQGSRCFAASSYWLVSFQLPSGPSPLNLTFPSGLLSMRETSTTSSPATAYTRSPGSGVTSAIPVTIPLPASRRCHDRAKGLDAVRILRRLVRSPSQDPREAHRDP